jgi:hypothetical protein
MQNIRLVGVRQGMKAICNRLGSGSAVAAERQVLP